MGLVPWKSIPRSLTVCSFDPDAGGDLIAQIAIRAIKFHVIPMGSRPSKEYALSFALRLEVKLMSGKIPLAPESQAYSLPL